MIKGETIHLRIVEQSDLETIRTWYSNPKLRGTDGILLPLTVPQMEKKYKDWSKQSHEVRMLIEKKDRSKLLGMIIIYTSYSGINLLIPNHNEEHKKAVIEAIDLALSYLFMEFDAKNSASVWIPSWNSWLIDIVKEYGMRGAGRERGVGMRAGKYYDSVAFDILKEEYLKQRQHK
ncbi:MAG: GNAT family N-acetyltransferase [Promethearchaeota archaeon]